MSDDRLVQWAREHREKLDAETRARDAETRKLEAAARSALAQSEAAVALLPIREHELIVLEATHKHQQAMLKIYANAAMWVSGAAMVAAAILLRC